MCPYMSCNECVSCARAATLRASACLAARESLLSVNVTTELVTESQGRASLPHTDALRVSLAMLNLLSSRTRRLDH